ncbi:MAG: hypothetical protein K0S07_27 [Chlamydiales bacterium]|jgi:uncharacterized protein (TIGR03067 family)|nr:hypothetical protein [Chlamydiales bacterium]
MFKKCFTWAALFTMAFTLRANPLQGAETQAEEPRPLSPSKWKVIGCQLNQVWLPPAIFEQFIYELVDEEHYQLQWGDLTFPKYLGGFPKSDQGSLKIDRTKTPIHIDLVPTSGPFAGKAFQGVLELDHDLLKVNFAFPGNERPISFSAKQGQVYEVWQRL